MLCLIVIAIFIIVNIILNQTDKQRITQRNDQCKEKVHFTMSQTCSKKKEGQGKIPIPPNLVKNRNYIKLDTLTFL